MISDHFTVVAYFKIPTNHSRSVLQNVSYRKLKAINTAAFKTDINNQELIRYPETNATELAQKYDSVLSILIDLHVPLLTKIDLPPFLLTHGWLQTSWLLKDIDIWSAGGAKFGCTK